MQIPTVVRAIVLLAGFSGAAVADIIVWRDNSGVSHYTNDISNVPSEYRGEAMTVAKDWSRTRPAKGSPPAVAAAATSVEADAGAAPTSRKAYEAAYAAGFRAGERADTAGSAGSVTEDEEDETEISSGAGGKRRTMVPDVVGGHRPRRSDHRDNRDSPTHDPVQSAESASEP
jgi:hypothetical protein